MAQYLPLPDGTSVTIRAGESPQDAWLRAQRMYPEAFGAKPAAKPETTFGGNVREFFKGLAPGAVGLVESAAVGASSLLPQDMEESARKRIAEIAGAAKAPFAAAPGYEEAVGRKLGEAGGSTIPFLALGPAGIAGRVGMAALGTGAGAGEARTRAEEDSATADQRGTATALGAVVGVSEMFAPLRILGRLSDPIKAGAAAQIKRIAAAGGEEAAQEAAAQIAQNLIAKGIYKPEQAIIEQVGESAAYGGAVGAMAQGLLDLALGRRASKAGTADEIAQARAEAEAARAAEEARKADPAYAQQFVADYEARRDAFVQARAALKNPGNDATPDVRQAYEEQKKALNKMRDALKDDAKEYNTLKGVVAQQAERARLEAMSPEDFFLEQAGMQVRPLAAAPTKTIIDEFGQIREVPVGGQEQETLTPAAQYLTRQMQGARSMGAVGLGELADFAMQNPEMARQAVAEQVQLDFLKPADNRALLGGINLRLKEVEKQRAAAMRDEMTQRAADIRAQAPTAETPDTAAQELGEFYQQKVQEGQGYVEPTFEYLDPIFEKAFNRPPVVAVKPEVMPVSDAAKLRQRVEGLLQQADAVDAGAAKLTKNPQAQAQAEQKIASIAAELNRLGQFGDEYTKEFVRLRNQQNDAAAKIADLTDNLRTGLTLQGRDAKLASNTIEGIERRIAEARAQFISASLQEAALHRRAEGKPALTQDEAVKAASKLFDTINTWTERAKTEPKRPEYEEVVVQPAQMRGTKIVKPAVTERRLVEPGQQGISPAEIRHFRERLDAVRRDLFAVPEPKGTRVEGEFLKRQYPAVEAAKVAEQRGETAQTLAGELRRRTEFVRNKMAKMGPMRPAARNALNKAADVLDSGKATRDILDKTEALVDAINNKLQVKQIDVQALEDALRASQPTAEEQRIAGQKSLDLAFEGPETEPAYEGKGRSEPIKDTKKRQIADDLGYIRMSPKNFANSPRIKPVWAALTKARATAARLKSKQERRRRIDKARIAAVERLSGEIDKLENRTEFFWKDQTKWTDAEIARSFVEFPDIADTPEDRTLVNKYLQKQKLTPQEQVRADALLSKFREKTRPEYDAKLKQAMSLLAEQGTLDAVENSLTKFMLDSNKQTREAAKALQERLSPYKRTIDALQQAMKGSPILTPAQKQLAAASDKARQRRDKFAATVKHAMDAARVEIEAVLEEVLDPEIARTEQALTKAEKDLATAKKDLERYKKKFDEILAVPGRLQDRTQLATYELFRYEEKQGVIQDLEQRIKQEAAQLADLYEARLESLSGAQLAAQAMLSKNVQYHRKLAVDAEKRLAALKGDNVLDKPGAYPFAASQAEAEIKTANAQVANAEAMKAAFDNQLASMKKQETPLYERMNKLRELGGIKRVEGRVEPIKTAEQVAREKELDELSREYQREQEKAQRDAIKQAQIDEAENRVVELTLDAARYDGPMDTEQLVTLLSQEGVSRNLKAQYTLKLDALQKLQIEEARIEALKEGRPAREPKPATVPTTAKQAAAKGFRTGYRKTLEAASEALASEREGRAPGSARGLLDPDAFVSSDDLGGLFEGRTAARLGDEESGLLSPARVNYQLAYDGVMWQDLPPKDATKAQVLKQLSQDFEAYGKAPGPGNLATVAAALREKYARMAASSSQPEKFREYLRELNALDLSKVEAPQAPRTTTPVAKRTTARSISSRFLNDTPEQTAEALATRYKAQGVADDAEYNGMTFAEAARYGARKTTSPMVRALFERLAEVFDKAPAARGGQGRVYALNGTLTAGQRAARGVFSHTDNTVVVSHGRTSTNKTLLHELMHAATFYGLDVNKELDQRVTELRNRVKDWLKTPEGRAYFRQKRMELQAQKPEEIYGLTDNDEFLAELYSDRGFQKLLTQVPSNAPRKNVFTRFIELLSKFFDMPSQAAQSAFADAVALSEEVLQTTVDQVYGSPTPIPTSTRGPLLSVEPTYVSPEMEAAGNKLDPFVTKQRGVNERVRAASGGFLGLETQLVDRFAGYERLRKYMPELQGSQMIYYLRMYDQRMNMVSQAVGTGAPVIAEKTRKDGKVERVIEAQEGPSIKGVVETLKDASPMVGNGEAVNRLFTAYMAGIRADNKGFESLNFGEGVTRADLDSALSVVNGNPELKAIFDKARGEYNEYNRNLINFVVETGALSRRTATRLLAENDYIPFYRERNGVAELLIGNETPIRIGSIKEQPYLQELVGGDQPILDFMTSSVQNTNMLIDMGMRNLATKNAVFELLDLSAAKLVRKAAGPDVVQFKVDGEDRYAVLATEKVKIGNKEFDTGVPADILVKGMEGIPTQMPFLFRALAIPAQLLRKGVTLSPMYVANQLFRDSLAAPIAAGANFTPVLGALRQIGKPAAETLERRGITGGQQFTGGADDMAMILRGIADGKPGWMNLLAKAEAVAMSADSLTRRAQYNSYIEQGMSEMEATLLALESMNFNKRGASPSIHIANALIPFFNAQIQGLNVLYKAMTGQMIFNDKLKIRQKLLQRGGMMAAASIVYAIMMQDDEAYKNAEADQKYGKWFVRIPGVDEPIRVPIPFEIGYIFKALPEALVNSMLDDHGGEQAVKAFKQIVLQTIPGGSSYGIPQAMKPAIEAGLGKSFYTGRDILSAREKELLPEEQFRNNTAEMSKLIGQVTGTSPIIFENLVRGYTGTMGLAFLHALSVGVPPGESPEKAVKRLSEYPIVGGAFQPNDAGGITNSMYERMNDAQKVERTYEKLVEEGRMAEAKALLQRRGNDFLQAELAKEFKANMNQLVAAERAIQASDLSPEEKRKQIDQIRKLKIAVAKEIRDVADKTVQLSFSL